MEMVTMAEEKRPKDTVVVGIVGKVEDLDTVIQVLEMIIKVESHQRTTVVVEAMAKVEENIVIQVPEEMVTKAEKNHRPKNTMVI
uniref:Uncharacterized protein n=1 Tax=Cucumis melo TaxID=3656 RepID=A0A9I9CGV5_CUCME